MRLQHVDGLQGFGRGSGRKASPTILLLSGIARAFSGTEPLSDLESRAGMTAEEDIASVAGQLADLTREVEEMNRQLKALRERADSQQARANSQQERSEIQQERIDLAARELAEVSERLQAAAKRPARVSLIATSFAEETKSQLDATSARPPCAV